MKHIYLLSSQRILLNASDINAYFIILFFFISSTVVCQIGDTYSFTQSLGNYQPISGTLIASHSGFSSNESSMDDVVYHLGPGSIPFDFIFDGKAYSSVQVSTNGFLILGSAPVSGTLYNPISSTASFPGAIAPFGRDLQGGFVFKADRTNGSPILTNISQQGPLQVGNFIRGPGIPGGTTITAISGNQITLSAPASGSSSGESYEAGGPSWSNIRYTTTGMQGNRVFTVQWHGFKRFGTWPGATLHMNLNFQIKLFEADHSIEIIYGNCTPGDATLYTINQVGLRGATGGIVKHFHNRTNKKGVNDNWLHSDQGTFNSAGMVYVGGEDTSIIPTGLIYRWSGPVCKQPQANVEVAENCSQSSFYLDVQMEDLGNADSVNIVCSPGNTLSGITSTGIYQFGPYGLGTQVSISIEHSSDTLCNLNLGTYVDCCGGECQSAIEAFEGINHCPIINCGNSPGNKGFKAMANHSRWFVWVASEDATLDITSCGAINTTNNDTRLTVYKGSCGNLEILATSDDDCAYGLGGSQFAARIIGLYVQQGNTYFIEWDDRWNSAAFDWTLAVGAPPCSSPATISTTSLSTNSATVSWSQPEGSTLFRYSLDNSPISCGSSSTQTTTNTSIPFSGLIPNTTYYFCVRTDECQSGGGPGEYSTFTFTTPPLANDNCLNATNVTCNSNTFGTSIGASDKSSLGTCSTAGIPGYGVWYKLTGTGAEVTASLCTSTNFDTKLYVYKGTCQTLECLISNDDFCSNKSQVAFQTMQDSVYYLLVTGKNGETGNFNINISCSCGVPLDVPWSIVQIGNAIGQGEENVCGGTIDISSNSYIYINSENLVFAYQEFCGNQKVIAKIENTINSGFGGVMMRETANNGSKFVGFDGSIHSNSSRRMVRSQLNGNINISNINTFNYDWLKIERISNFFYFYYSSNGINWAFAGGVSNTMSNCIQIGVYATSLSATTSTSIFSTVQITNGESIWDASNMLKGITEIPDIQIYPNPATERINIKNPGWRISGIQGSNIQLYNYLGQAVSQYQFDSQDYNNEITIETGHLVSGVYYLTIVQDGKELHAQKIVIAR